MQHTNLKPAIIQFIHLLNTSNVITVDDGPLLTEWVVESDIDCENPKNLVLTCTYTGSEGDFEESFNVGNICNGIWNNTGEVLELLNSRNEPAHIRFFKLKGLNKDGSVMDKTMSDLSADFLNTMNMFTNDAVNEFIEQLKKFGWVEHSDGLITHPANLMSRVPTFTSWNELIKHVINTAPIHQGEFHE